MEMEGGEGKERASTNVIIEVVNGENSMEGDSGREKVKGETLADDVESGGKCFEREREKICRICHLSTELVGSTGEEWELIEIGCGCKGELGIAHRRCAEAWFRVKGNRLCEICGSNAESIVGKEDFSFMEVWHEGERMPGVTNNQNSSNQGTYWTSQRFCSFLVSFLVIAFILQWYFRESFG